MTKQLFKAAAGLAVLLALASQPAVAGYVQTNLVSNGAVPAAHIDPNLVNPWGISYSPTGPFWISDNGTGVSTLYDGSGNPQPLVVTIPPPGAGNPTGQVFNPTTFFHNDKFLFVSEDGTISGWRGSLGTTAEVAVPGSSANVYKGVTLGSVGAQTLLYAANFRAGRIDVFNGDFHKISLGPNAFKDPNLPKEYSPFNVQNIGGNLFVTYAKPNAARHDDSPGAGRGFVDEFDTKGNLIRRIATGQPGNPNNPLNSPWGLALAPSNFGKFSGKLLVGNFGSGVIDVYDPNSTNQFLGQLTDPSGKVITIDGLWALTFGNGGKAGSTNILYFTAGINGEADGLFGQLQSTPEPTTLALLAIGGAGMGLAGVWRARKR